MKPKDKYAVVSISGSQHIVSEGDELVVSKISETGPKGDLSFSQVLLVKNNDKISIGQPTVAGAEVKAQVTGDLLGKKVRVATYTAKSRHRKVTGHRDQLTRVKIMAIIEGKKSVKN